MGNTKVAMLDVMGSRELEVVAVTDRHRGLPTSRPRKKGIQGKVIDFIASARACTGPAWIQEDSCHIIGTDHEIVMCMGYLEADHLAKRRYDCRPRMVIGDIPEQHHYDQQVLKGLARRYTRVIQGKAYKDPEEVKAAFRRAKVQKTATAWKLAQQQRKQARAQWEKERLDGLRRATGKISG